MKHPNELIVPPDALTDPAATEVLRAWMVDDALQVTLLPHALPEAGAWGLVLADIARHLSDAYEKDNGQDPTQTLQQVLEVFIAELTSPTDTTEGNFE